MSDFDDLTGAKFHGFTPDGMDIRSKKVNRSEGLVHRVFIVDPNTGRILHGHQVGKNATEEDVEAVAEKCRSGEYDAHISAK